MLELKFSVECRAGTDVYQIGGIYPSFGEVESKDIVNELINGKEFHDIEEIITYLFTELRARGVKIEKNNIQLMSETK